MMEKTNYFFAKSQKNAYLCPAFENRVMGIGSPTPKSNDNWSEFE